MSLRRKTLVVCFFVFAVLHTMTALADTIEWRVYLKSHRADGPLVAKTTSEGEEFVIRESECSRIPSESSQLVSALDGVSFMLRQSPANGDLAIYIILNANGNTFEKASGVSLFLNMTFEAYINGNRESLLSFSSSPLEITIPQDGLNELLSACSLSRSNLVCAFNTGGKFTADGIITQDATTRMIIRMSKLSPTVGGNENDLGVPSSVKYDTWSKIKLLFK